MDYTPPNPEQLRALKTSLDFTGEEMAALFALGGGHQWRKYTGGAEPRPMGLHMMFFACARLTLSAEALHAVSEAMRAAGAELDDVESVTRR